MLRKIPNWAYRLAHLLPILLCSCIFVPVVEAAAENRLVSPFDITAQGKLFKHRSDPFTCPAVPPSVINLHGTRIYRDSKGSIIDPPGFAAATRQEAPIRSFTSGLNNIAEYYATHGLDPSPLHCLLARMAAWARAGALLGEADLVGVNFQNLGISPTCHEFQYNRACRARRPRNETNPHLAVDFSRSKS